MVILHLSPNVCCLHSVELLFTIFFMLLGAGFYSILIGIVSAFFTSKDDINSLLKKKLVSVEEFCNSLGIKEDFQNKLQEKIKYSSSKLAYQWLSPAEDIFSELNTQLKYEFLVALNQNLIQSCEFFKNKDISFIVRVVPLLKPVKFDAGELIWSPDDFSTNGRKFFISAYDTRRQSFTLSF